jgi:hypothetical protein
MYVNARVNGVLDGAKRPHRCQGRGPVMGGVACSSRAHLLSQAAEVNTHSLGPL